jgi:hypothetical protein
MSNVSTTDASVIASTAPTASTAASKLKAADQAAQGQSDQSVNSHAQSCPLIDRFAIEAVVVGEDDKPLMDVGVELRKSPKEVLRDRTGTDGAVRFEQLVGGGYQLSLYELDKDAWELLETVALAKPNSQGDAAWQVPTPPENSAEFTHTVIQGECTITLADRYGLLPDRVWNWPENDQLKSLRVDKSILYPGDQLVIPPKRYNAISANTGKIYCLKRKAALTKFQMRFLFDWKPRVNLPYHISFQTLDGQIIPGRTGTTNQDGILTEPIFANFSLATVTLTQEESPEIHEFSLAEMDPIDTISGVRKRLYCLGYECDQNSDQSDDDFKVALNRFQFDYKLNQTDDIDATTRKQLTEIFGC